MKPLSYVFLIGLLVFAFWLRLDRLDTYPPGLSSDESMNTVDAFDIAHSGRLPFYEDSERPEYLYRIVLAVGVRLFGPSVWAYRVVSVFLGTLTAAAAYWAMGECVADLRPPARRAAGLVAAAVMAVALSHIVLSRALYRGMPLVLFLLLYVGALLRGLRTHRRRDFVWSGISLGLALHSYTSGLAAPASVGAVGLSLLIFRRRAWRHWLPGLAWLAAAAAVIAAPIAVMLAADSSRVMIRAQDVGGDEGLSLDNWQARAERVWKQYFERGDINSQYNADRAPLLPPGFAWLFRLGLLALVVRLRHPSSALLAALLVLTALPVMATAEIPHGLRIIGAFAVFPLVTGAGAAVILALIAKIPRRGALNAGSALVIAALAALTLRDGLDAHRRYLDWWDDNSHPWRVYGLALRHGDWFFRTDLRDLGRWLSDQDDPLLVPVETLASSVTRTWLYGAYPDVRAPGDAVTLPGEGLRLVVPWALELGDLRRDARQFGLLHDGAITLLPPFTAEAQAALMAGIDAAEAVHRANGDLLLRVKAVPPGLALAFEARSPNPRAPEPLAVFDDQAEVVGWRGPITLDGAAPQAVQVTLDWSARRTPNHWYTAFVQIQTQDYAALAGTDVPIWRWLYNPTRWQPGDVVPAVYTLDLPGGPAPGAYRLVAGLYMTRFTHLGQPVTSAAWGSTGTMATLAWLKVPQPEPPALDPALPRLDVRVGEWFALRQASAARGEDGVLRVTLTWESLVDRPPVDATVFVHVLGPDGQMVTQSDLRPWGGQYPTFIWDAGERVQTVHPLDPGAAPPGDLRVVAGMYTFPGPTRLAVRQDGAPAPDGLIDLGTLGALGTPP